MADCVPIAASKQTAGKAQDHNNKYNSNLWSTYGKQSAKEDRRPQQKVMEMKNCSAVQALLRHGMVFLRPSEPTHWTALLYFSQCHLLLNIFWVLVN
jgi:hypothetical protein